MILSPGNREGGTVALGTPRPLDTAALSMALLGVKELYCRWEFGSEVPTSTTRTLGAWPATKPIQNMPRQIIISSLYLIPHSWPFQSKFFMPPGSDSKTQWPWASCKCQKDDSSQIKPAHKWGPGALLGASSFKQAPLSRALDLRKKHWSITCSHCGPQRLLQLLVVQKKHFFSWKICCEFFPSSKI